MRIINSKKYISKVKALPDIVQIAVTNRCNLNCGMCLRKSLGVPYEDMELNIYKAIIDKLPASVKGVVLTGWGEPLLHPDIWVMVNYTRRKNFITHLITNGILLNHDNQKRLFESRLDSIIVSLESTKSSDCQYGIHPYSKETIRNVERLVKLRGDNAEPHVSLCVILHKGRKKSVLEIVKFAQRHNVDTVHLGRLINVSNRRVERSSSKEELAIWRECLNLRKKGKPDIIITHLQYLGLQKLYPIDKFCPKIYNFVYINVRGKITPCCNLPNYVVGDILKEDLGAVWTGIKFKDFRIRQEKICKRICNLYTY